MKIKDHKRLIDLYYKDGVNKVLHWNHNFEKSHGLNEPLYSWWLPVYIIKVLLCFMFRTICGCQVFWFLCNSTRFFELPENLILYCEAYLPGAGDTMIMKVVLPGRGLSIALRLGWLLQVILMRLPWAHNFC